MNNDYKATSNDTHKSFFCNGHLPHSLGNCHRSLRGAWDGQTSYGTHEVSRLIDEAMFQGKTAYNPTEVQQISVGVSKQAEKIPSMFPEGSDKHPSEAKATIWSNWGGFERAASALGEQAAMLSKAVEEKAAAAKSFKQLANTCKGCHQDFREKKS